MQSTARTTPTWLHCTLWCFSSWMVIRVGSQSVKSAWSSRSNKLFSHSHLPVTPLENPLWILNQGSHKCYMNIIIKVFWTWNYGIQVFTLNSIYLVQNFFSLCDSETNLSLKIEWNANVYPIFKRTSYERSPHQKLSMLFPYIDKLWNNN